MDEPKLEVAVGMSRRWDAREAGREVARTTIEKLSHPPSFFLLFSTIHHEKHGGFQKLLNSIFDVLPENTPLIGGTVTGFICPEGCYTRGVVGVAVYGEGIDIAAGCAKNTRANPVFAGKKIARDIHNKVGKSTRKNKLMITFMSGPLEPRIFTLEILRRITQLIPHKLLCFFRDILLGIGVKYFQTGPGAEENVLRGMEDILKDYSIIGCSTFDDMKCLRHYQFYNRQVLDGTLVGLGLALDNELILDEKIQLTSTGKKFKVKKGWNEYCIDEMDNEPYMMKYITEMGWPISYIKTHVEQLTRVTFYYPMGFRSDDWIFAFPAGIFFGDTMLTNRQIRTDDVELFLTPPGKDIFLDYKNYFEMTSSKDIAFTFIIEAMWIYGVFGSNVYDIKDVVDKALKDKPYLIIFGAGEHFKKPNEKARLNDYARVMFSILNSSEIQS